MMKNEQLSEMFHSHSHRNNGGFDEVDGAGSGASGTKPQQVIERLQSVPDVFSQPSKFQFGSLQSSHDASFQDDFQDFQSDCGPNSLISRDEVPGLPFALSPKRADGNHGPIGGPITSAVIGPEGGHLEIYGNILTIPRGALRDWTTIELGLVWNKRLRPSFGTDCQMTAILSCQPSGVRFCKPVVLSLPHCLEVNPFKGNQIRPVLYSSHHVNNGIPEWTRCRPHDYGFTFRDQSIEVKVHDFCYLVWCFEDDRPDVDAKKIRIVPYASPISPGQDQKIRLHVFSDLEAVREKVKKEEEELGGVRLTSYRSYVLLKNWGMLRMETTWNTVGWVLSTSPIITMPFREMWASDHNSCELHFINQMQKPDFKCNIVIWQDKNESKVELSFGHDVQVNFSDRLEAEPGTDAGVASLSHEEQGPISGGSLVSQLYLPQVPPLPEVARSCLSISKTCISSNARNGSREQHVEVAERFFSSSTAESGTTRRIISAPALGECDQNTSVPAIHEVKSMEVAPLTWKERGPLQYGSPAICQEATPAHESLNIAEPVSWGRQLATNNFFVQNMNFTGRGYVEQFAPRMVESKSIIPFQLKRSLSVKLDERISVKNWMDLSKHWGLSTQYDETAMSNYNADKPGWIILCAAEEKQIVKSLDDLRKAFKDIGRDDCVDTVNEYEGISSNTACDSDS